MNSEFCRVVVIGLGNIGSQLTALLARNPKIARLLLIDPGIYCEDNLSQQQIDAAAIGNTKVNYVKAQLNRVNDKLAVKVIARRLQEIPMGIFLDYDVILLCVDNNVARQFASQLALRLDLILIDAAVGFNRYFRVRVLMGKRGPCIECGWGGSEYALLGEEYQCGSIRDIATDSSIELGSIAAAYQSIQLNAVLRDGAPAESYQLFGDTSAPGINRHTYSRNSNCRFDHQSFVPSSSILASLAISNLCGNLLRVPGAVGFARRSICQSCFNQSVLSPPVLVRHLESRGQCECGGTVSPVPTGLSSQLRLADLSPSEKVLAICEFGIRPGDLLQLDHKQHVCLVEKEHE